MQKKRKPSIDIHMLGCTEYSMLKDISFCTTADSTSWLSGVKYGYFDDGVKKSHIRNFRRDIFEERKKIIQKIIDERNVPLKEKTIEYATNASLCASICKERYTRLAGNQD